MTPARLELTLRDGTPVVARPLGPADRAYVAEAYRRLSPESRYQRFWVHTGEVIGERMLDRLLDADGHNHVVWAVLEPAREFPALGGASYWRSATNPAEAEFSVTVLDADHGRSVGTLLLAILWLVAFANGIRQFVGYVMPDNRRAVRWMIDSGACGEWDGYKAIFRWNLENLTALPLTPVAGDLAERLAELAPVILP